MTGTQSQSQGETTPKPRHDTPQPSTPKPGDPRERTPMQDPPLEPERDPNPQELQSDDDESADVEERSEAGREGESNPSPDQTVFDENKSGK